MNYVTASMLLTLATLLVWFGRLLQRFEHLEREISKALPVLTARFDRFENAYQLEIADVKARLRALEGSK